ncbi:hypothetical protein C8Q78DRAFT_995393 [Trametes maxima]|nr:hypothetical protein C8Q78DRAFT_995393 [Trametes maxima]
MLRTGLTSHRTKSLCCGSEPRPGHPTPDPRKRGHPRVRKKCQNTCHFEHCVHFDGRAGRKRAAAEVAYQHTTTKSGHNVKGNRPGEGWYEENAGDRDGVKMRTSPTTISKGVRCGHWCSASRSVSIYQRMRPWLINLLAQKRSYHTHHPMQKYRSRMLESTQCYKHRIRHYYKSATPNWTSRGAAKNLQKIFPLCSPRVTPLLEERRHEDRRTVRASARRYQVDV